MKKDLVSIKDLKAEEITYLIELTGKIKRKEVDFSASLEGKTLGLVFQKPSARTRVSFEAGVYQLGGNVVYLSPEDLRLGERESIKDIARVLSRYLDVVVARTFAHEHIIELAQHAGIPVINGLSDLLHPCQVLSDLYTIKENKGDFNGLTLAFIGDGNNVAHSLIHGCAKAGINLNIATPKGYEPNSEILEAAETIACASGVRLRLLNDPQEALYLADVVYTDVWASMGQEHQRKKRLKDFKGFQLDKDLLSRARPDAVVMHCLPAHRGEEITDEVIDGEKSIVFDQAENRLYMQKAILVYLLGLDK